MPFFSVIIPLYNKECSVCKTLKSVLEQSYEDFEIVIINDGSTDNSEDIVLNFKDSRIKYFYRENSGVADARNLGIKKATGKFIAFLDADDYWYPNHLEVLFQLYLKFPEAGLYSTSYEKRYNSKSTFPANFRNIDAKGEDFLIVDDFFDSNTIDQIVWTSACAIPIKIFDSIGLFDNTITHGAGEDTDLWIRIALHFEVALATFITATYNLDATNRISNTNTLKRRFLDFNKFKKEEKINQSLKKYLDQNRYAISILYKIAGDYRTAKNYRTEINYKNLNTKQKILLWLPRTLLISFKTIQNKLILMAGFKLSSFE
ncbi:glycosyltransferase family 2 protein [Aquimarina sp. RZ0]|uniref:glycosyltransferase family 2 protein n=1 Tax=Aquimarina sp. RZ0 TaxID=2607730 RepID=UPI00165EF503|nr:glycosyltransferase family 2 protein [Aquimarina sp. RZ0]